MPLQQILELKGFEDTLLPQLRLIEQAQGAAQGEEQMAAPTVLAPIHQQRAAERLRVGLGFWSVLIVAVVLLIAPPRPALASSCPADMVAIPARSYRIGAGGQKPEEGPPVLVRLNPFCLATHEVTNREFAAFEEATGYRTVAERPLPTEQFPVLSAAERAPGSLVFRPLAAGEAIGPMAGWHWMPGADWRHPEGPGSSIKNRSDHPVVQVAYEDAEAYAACASSSST